MKHLYEYINEKLVLNNKTKIRGARKYTRDDFENIKYLIKKYPEYSFRVS